MNHLLCFFPSVNECFSHAVTRLAIYIESLLLPKSNANEIQDTNGHQNPAQETMKTNEYGWPVINHDASNFIHLEWKGIYMALDASFTTVYIDKEIYQTSWQWSSPCMCTTRKACI